VSPKGAYNISAGVGFLAFFSAKEFTSIVSWIYTDTKPPFPIPLAPHIIYSIAE